MNPTSSLVWHPLITNSCVGAMRPLWQPDGKGDLLTLVMAPVVPLKGGDHDIFEICFLFLFLFFNTIFTNASNYLNFC